MRTVACLNRARKSKFIIIISFHVPRSARRWWSTSRDVCRVRGASFNSVRTASASSRARLAMSAVSVARAHAVCAALSPVAEYSRKAETLRPRLHLTAVPSSRGGRQLLLRQQRFAEQVAGNIWECLPCSWRLFQPCAQRLRQWEGASG